MWDDALNYHVFGAKPIANHGLLDPKSLWASKGREKGKKRAHVKTSALLLVLSLPFYGLPRRLGYQQSQRHVIAFLQGLRRREGLRASPPSIF